MERGRPAAGMGAEALPFWGKYNPVFENLENEDESESIMPAFDRLCEGAPPLV